MNLPPYKATEDLEAHRRVMDEMRERIGVDMPREGVHVSDLVFCLRKGWALHKLDQQPGGRYEYIESTPDEQALVWVIGHSHEAIFGHGRTRGLPQEQDGIVGTPDFFDEGLVEMKSTRSSAKKSIEDMEHYVAQASAYAAMFGYVDVHVYVLHLMGDYNRDGPVSAKLRVWKLSFTKEDLAAWWQELIRRRDVLVGEEQPPADPMWGWECGYCRVRSLIDCPGGDEWQREQAKKKQKQSLD